MAKSGLAVKAAVAGDAECAIAAQQAQHAAVPSAAHKLQEAFNTNPAAAAASERGKLQGRPEIGVPPAVAVGRVKEEAA